MLRSLLTERKCFYNPFIGFLNRNEVESSILLTCPIMPVFGIGT